MHTLPDVIVCSEQLIAGPPLLPVSSRPGPQHTWAQTPPPILLPSNKSRLARKEREYYLYIVYGTPAVCSGVLHKDSNGPGESERLDIARYCYVPSEAFSSTYPAVAKR